MIDLHCHLLPGIDDGAANLEEALAMGAAAAAAGSTALVATPHLRHERWWNADRAALEERWRSVREALDGTIGLYLGGEIAVSSQSFDELLQLPDGELLTLAGSRYVLLELDRRGFGPDPFELVHELRVRDLYPVFAHPERIPWMAASLELMRLLVESGAYLQITALSVTGGLGRALADVAARLLDAGLVHFIASDSHDPRLRPPCLATAYRHVARRWGRATAEAIFLEHPRLVLEDRPLALADTAAVAEA